MIIEIGIKIKISPPKTLLPLISINLRSKSLKKIKINITKKIVRVIYLLESMLPKLPKKLGQRFELY